jgi:glycerol-3-phosphate acyltransferase PlsY
LFPVSVICSVTIVWIGVFYASKYVSLASMASAIALPCTVLLFVPKTGAEFWTLFIFTVLIAALALWRHRANIERLRNGTESRFGKK